MSVIRTLTLSLLAVLLVGSTALARPDEADRSGDDGDQFDEVITAELGAASSQAAMDELEARLKHLAEQEKKTDQAITELEKLEKKEQELKKLETVSDPDPRLARDARDYDDAPPGLGLLGDERIAEMTARLFELIEGNAGALVMVLAGIAALISAAFGAYRAAISLLVVAVGAFILRSLVEIFFNYTG